MEHKILTVKQTATWLGVRTHTIYALIKSGDLPALKIGRTIRLVESDILAYCRYKAEPKTPLTPSTKNACHPPESIISYPGYGVEAGQKVVL